LLKGIKCVEVSPGKWEFPPNKPATINNLMRTLKHAFTKAADWNWISDETLKQVRKVKLLQENNRRLRYLSKEECHVLINTCSDHLKPIVITAINTGMRKSEILSLKWPQVDLKHGFILRQDEERTKAEILLMTSGNASGTSIAFLDLHRRECVH
jgi:integrase